MADDLEARLGAAAAAAREHELTAERCEELRRRVEETERHVASLWAARVAEHRDVTRLEGLSLSRILASLRGDRDERLARERAEAEAVAFRIADAEAGLQALVRELRAAEARIQGLAGAPATYEVVLAEKADALQAGGDPRGRRLLELAEEKGRLTSERHEVEEGLHTATVAHQALRRIDDLLGRASQWSGTDVVPGGWAPDQMKYNRLDEAAAVAAQADRCLAMLRTEMADLGEPGPTAPALELDRSTRFLDVWLDNPFTDWKVGQRIRQARAQVVDRRGLVELVQFRLERRMSEVRARLEAVEAERRELIGPDLG